MSTLLHNPAIGQFIRFSIVGCMNVLVSTAVYYLSYTQWHPADLLLSLDKANASPPALGYDSKSLNGTFSSILAYSAGMVQSFILNKFWTFKVRKGGVYQARRFVLLNLAGLLLTTAIIYVSVDLLNAHYMAAWLFAVLIVMIFNFVGNKYWTFI